MKKEIIHIDKERGIARTTTLDERWYSREIYDSVTGLPRIDFRPSITYIGGFYPKGKGFEQYLKKNGDGSEEIAQLAAERGSKVHQAIEALNSGLKVKMQERFVNSKTGQEEDLTPDEYWAVMTYCNWWRDEGSKGYEIIEAEKTVWPNGPGSEPGGPLHFAGTLDILARRISDGRLGVIDIKTSKAIYTSHIIQLSALREGKCAEGLDVSWQAILQVGYRGNKAGYKFSEQEHRFDQFLHAKGICDYETTGDKPLQREYPLELSLGIKAGAPSTLTVEAKETIVKAREKELKAKKK